MEVEIFGFPAMTTGGLGRKQTFATGQKQSLPLVAALMRTGGNVSVRFNGRFDANTHNGYILQPYFALK